MIFVTVGTGPSGFDRLIRMVDDIATDLDGSFRVQIGNGEYVPENVDWFRFMPDSEILELYCEASVVVAHAGAGTILTALSHESPVVLVPRRERYDDVFDDHQLELTNALSGRKDVFVVTETDDLKTAIETARSQSVESVGDNNSLINFLEGYINELER